MNLNLIIVCIVVVFYQLIQINILYYIFRIKTIRIKKNEKLPEVPICKVIKNGTTNDINKYLYSFDLFCKILIQI